MNETQEDSNESEVLRVELEKEKKRNEEILTRLRYAQADLENYRKRTDRMVNEARDSSTKELVTRLLLVLDELALAVKHSAGKEQGKEMKEGLKMVEKNLASALESVGLEKIDCLGKPFDPTLHEAVEKVEGPGRGRDTVVEELRPGFLFRGQVIRPSMVKVQLGTGNSEEESSET